MDGFKRVDRGANERTAAVAQRIAEASGVPNSLVGSVDPFDPGKHSVGDVLQYLGDSDDETEVERVLAAEAEGKARKGVLSFAQAD